MTFRPNPTGAAYVRCDGCGAHRNGRRVDGTLCEWLMRGKAPPGWLHVDPRQDFCPMCRARLEGLA